MFRKISLHASFHSLIEPFEDTRLGLLVVNGVVMDAVLLQQTLDGTVQEFQSFICLHRRRTVVDGQVFQCRHQRRCRLLFRVECTRRPPRRHYRERNVVPLLSFSVRQIKENDLPLLVASSHDEATPLETTSQRFMQVYASCSINHCSTAIFRHARDAPLGVDSAVTSRLLCVEVDVFEVIDE